MDMNIYLNTYTHANTMPSAARGESVFFITSHRLSGTEEDPVAIEAKRENSFPFCGECPSDSYSGESASLVLLDNIHHHW